MAFTESRVGEDGASLLGTMTRNEVRLSCRLSRVEANPLGYAMGNGVAPPCRLDRKVNQWRRKVYRTICQLCNVHEMLARLFWAGTYAGYPLFRIENRASQDTAHPILRSENQGTHFSATGAIILPAFNFVSRLIKRPSSVQNLLNLTDVHRVAANSTQF